MFTEQADYITARFKNEPGSYNSLDLTITDTTITLSEGANPVGVIKLAKSGKTFSVVVAGVKIGGAVRSLDAAIARLQGCVVQRNWFAAVASIV